MEPEEVEDDSADSEGATDPHVGPPDVEAGAPAVAPGAGAPKTKPRVAPAAKRKRVTRLGRVAGALLAVDVVRLYGLVGGVAAAGFVAVLLLGGSYYVLPIAQRLAHPLHALLRPSGWWGLSFGVVGMVLMVLNLTYLLRKKRLGWKWLGSLRSWMAFHILTGLVGPALIVLHAAFRPSSSTGMLAFAAMLVVVIAGVVGRYIYGMVPRSVEGRELQLGEVRRRLDALRHAVERLGLTSTLLTGERDGDGVERSVTLFGAFVGLAIGDRKYRQELRRLKGVVLEDPQLRLRAKGILRIARRLYREEQWVARYYDAQMLMASWRFFHRWLAIVMLLLAFFHAGLALRFGNLWIFGGTP